MIDKKKILQQIQSDEDKILVSRLFDLAKSARGGWRPSGFFLDRGKCLKIPLWFGDCEPVLWGGYPDAERCMVSFGEKEAEAGLVSVRSRYLGDEGQKSLDTFVNDICKEIRTKEIRKIEVEEQK